MWLDGKYNILSYLILSISFTQLNVFSNNIENTKPK